MELSDRWNGELDGKTRLINGGKGFPGEIAESEVMRLSVISALSSYHTCCGCALSIVDVARG